MLKKITVITVCLLSLLVNPLFSSPAMADDQGITIMTPFSKVDVKAEPRLIADHQDNNQFSYQVTPQEVDLLAHMVYGEARGESQEGKVAIAAVILNRTRDVKFPHNVKDVMFEPDAFTAVSDGQFNLRPDQTAYEAVDEALKGADPTDGALYYWNPQTATSGWVWSRTVIKQIGQHLFAK